MSKIFFHLRLIVNDIVYNRHKAVIGKRSCQKALVADDQMSLSFFLSRCSIRQCGARNNKAPYRITFYMRGTGKFGCERTRRGCLSDTGHTGNKPDI